MRDVYSHLACTIAALCAGDSTESLPVLNDSPCRDLCQVRVESAGTASLDYVITGRHTWLDAVSSAPLNRRA
jgi:hypothetical protein